MAAHSPSVHRRANAACISGVRGVHRSCNRRLHRGDGEVLPSLDLICLEGQPVTSFEKFFALLLACNRIGHKNGIKISSPKEMLRTLYPIVLQFSTSLTPL